MDVKELEKKWGRCTIHLASKDRHSEVAVCLQSLRTQTYQAFDLIILDDASGTQLISHHPSMSLVQRMKFEGHKIKLLRNNFSNGICAARNKLILEDDFENPLTFRVDDDCIYEPDYIERLVKILEKGYSIATGIVPVTSMPEFERENKFIGDVIARHELDEVGNIIERKDELGMSYLSEGIYLCDQFRTSCLYLSKLHKEIKYPSHVLSFVSFREELWFSFQAILKGYKIGCDVKAKAFHNVCPSGGTRVPEYSNKVLLDEQTTNKQVKEWFLTFGNFLKKYHEDNLNANTN